LFDEALWKGFLSKIADYFGLEADERVKFEAVLPQSLRGIREKNADAFYDYIFLRVKNT